MGSFGVRKGAWTKEEDILLSQCIEKYGEGRWHRKFLSEQVASRTANDVKNYWNTHLCKKAQDIVKVIAIKPQPRTLSKNLTLASGKPIIAERFQLYENVNDVSPTLKPLEYKINWWESLLNSEAGGEKVQVS
ncbi:transcription factor myb113 [Quercus suber]|uniref:Transcription factor myb113 n=1 Tax=Quercus suber TaxID=58331 RepID=A0AAW0LQ25_QUESU